MTQLHFADLVRERSLATGTGPFALEGALPGHRSFAAAVPVAARFHYTIAGVSRPGEWEVGEGVIDSAGLLVRQPLSSSNAGALVNFGAGLKTVALTVAAPWFAARDTPVSGGGGSGGTVTIAGVSGLEAALAGKQPAGAYAPATHSHVHYWAADASGHYTIATGRVGIGTLSPQRKLDIGGTVTDTTARLHSPGEGPASDASLDLWAGHPNVSPMAAGIGANIAGHPSLGKRNPANPAGFIEFTGSGGLRIELCDGPGVLTRRLTMGASGSVVPGIDNSQALGSAALRWTQIYASSGAISTSDARDKKWVGAIPDSWLDAWGDVSWSRYQMRKGRRWHVGLVAQQVADAFAARGLDARAIGLVCHDRWDGETEPVISKRTGQPMPKRVRQVRKPGARWGLRYDECFAMEAAFVRRALSHQKSARM